MKLRFILALVFLFVISAASVVAQKSRVPASDYFPLRVGNSWTYHHDGGGEFTYKVVSSEKQPDGTLLYLMEMHAGIDIQYWYSKESQWVLLHRESYPKQEGMDQKFVPARQYLRNPLVRGAKWDWKGKNITGTDMVESNEVVGPVVLQVPAGKFRAMKVVSLVTAGEGSVTNTYWYAPGVGLIKLLTEAPGVKYGWELKDYSFRKASSR